MGDLSDKAKEKIILEGLTERQKEAMIWLLSNGGFYVDQEGMIYVERKTHSSTTEELIASFEENNPGTYNVLRKRDDVILHGQYDRIKFFYDSFFAAKSQKPSSKDSLNSARSEYNRSAL